MSRTLFKSGNEKALRLKSYFQSEKFADKI